MNSKEEIIYTPEQRVLINKAIKASNRQKGSKYIKPSFSLVGFSYNESRKPEVNYNAITEQQIEQAAKQVLLKQNQ